MHQRGASAFSASTEQTRSVVRMFYQDLLLTEGCTFQPRWPPRAPEALRPER